MKKKNRRFSAYQQSLFNKYEIDESYLQTHKQRRACLELLEQIDKNQRIDEPKMIGKIASAFQGSELCKKIASCMTIASLLVTLQSTPAMALAASSFQPSSSITEVYELPASNSIVMDEDSFLDITKSPVQQTVKNTSIHLVANTVLKNEYETMADKGVIIDGDSDITYYPKQEHRTLTVIDTNLQDWQTIRDAVKEGEVLLLDGDEDPLDAILDKLEDMKEIDCLNIISHGSSGKLEFENEVMTSDTLENNKDKWEKLSGYLDQEGDIQLFGCNIAKGEAGKTFINKLAQITDVDVAASINPTGADYKGGDWELEAHVGDIASNLPFTKQAILQFLHLLPLTVDNQTFNLSTFTDNNPAINPAPGPDSTIFNEYFVVSGTVDGNPTNINKDGSSAYLCDSTITASNAIKVNVDGLHLGSFELENIYLGNFGLGDIYDVYVVGHKAGGGPLDTVDTGLASISVGSTLTINTAELSDFSEQPLDYFTIHFSNSYQPMDLSFNSFTVSNMTAPVTNHAPSASEHTFSTDEDTVLNDSLTALRPMRTRETA